MAHRRYKVARARRGLTLIEAVVSLVIISVLMLGLSGSVMLGVRALPSDTELGAADREVQQMLNTLRSDISGASAITLQKSGNSVRMILTMISTGAVGEPSSVVYDFIGDVDLIRRRTDSNAYIVLTTEMDGYRVESDTDSGRLNYVHFQFKFDHTIQQQFEVHVLTPYQPGVS